jgi:hypothetical protein
MAEAQSTIPTGVYAGAELYFAQPRVGDGATFALGSDFDNGGPDIQTRNITFDFQASPKAYFGWRSANTGDAVQFSYWHFDQAAETGFTITDGSTAFIPLSTLDDPQPYFEIGDSILSRRTLNFNVYDIDYLKSLAFSGGRWLVTGSLGARIADIGQTESVVATVAGGEFSESGATTINFIGAGPRLTLEGRRNLGSYFSLYARGGYSILLGSLESTISSEQAFDDDSIRISDNRDRTVTVTEIELGASWSVTQNFILTGGYLFQAWSGLNNSIGQAVVIENSDFISFNGLVVRGIYSF